jgi:hypothetical protein
MTSDHGAASTGGIRTKDVVDRRGLSFSTIADFLVDVESFGDTPPASSGNWTAAMNVQHITRTIEGSIDGFGFMIPAPVRWLLRPFRHRFLTGPMKAGYSIPTRMSDRVAPDPEVTWEQAVADLAAVIDRVERGARMTSPSPLLGSLTHEGWQSLHCRHAELHFGFFRA